MSALDPEPPTPFPDINAVLRRFVAGVRVALGERLVGLYLSGSLAAGDFEYGSSDIDFLAVTAGALAPDALAALTALHAEMIASGLPYADRLEGIYLPQVAAQRYDPANARHPLSAQANGLRVTALDRSWVIQYHQAREVGIPLYGPPASTFIDPVSPGELRAVARTCLREGWSRA